MKLMYNRMECTFVRFLSAILATSTASEDSTLAIVVLLIETKEACEMASVPFRVGDGLSRIIKDATKGQCEVIQ